MTDMVSAERRSQIMARIRSTDTTPEMTVRRLLHRMGYRFRLHVRDLPGRPDIVLPKYKTAILVHGCFWHGHRCKDGRRPKSNMGYWNGKLDRNKNRDKINKQRLRRAGWKPVVIWACQCTEEDRLMDIIRNALDE
ncbi:MAG: DNA mismatch endonuclease Vsr [Candidatus Tectomicrobia bacterium]|nr:DNA mismatch endonuclease Vsr [Candidatus Tectomicrobia bacterium]